MLGQIRLGPCLAFLWTYIYYMNVGGALGRGPAPYSFYGKFRSFITAALPFPPQSPLSHLLLLSLTYSLPSLFLPLSLTLNIYQQT